jgi:hypothetical protein
MGKQRQSSTIFDLNMQPLQVQTQYYDDFYSKTFENSQTNLHDISYEVFLKKFSSNSKRHDHYSTGWDDY